ncbi:unnamed protein product [Dicrocoelium dendriticum]|nr:unnamed protein product [Dicrocoelium dendriticum]
MEYPFPNHLLAIIGAGMGGATAAYYLRQLFGSEVGITVFEQSGRIGGRIKSANFAGQLIETGASIYHTSNLYMVNFAKKFGLSVQDMSASDDRIMIYDGRGGLSFSSLNGPSFFVQFRMLQRYGLQLIQLRSATSSLIQDFSSIYSLQDSGECFATPASLLAAITPEFVEMTKWTFGDWLRQLTKISDPLISEIAYGAVSKNTCQNLNVHAFVGFISLAGMTPKLAAIRDGNELVPKMLIEHALEHNPTGNPGGFIHAKVTAIQPSTSVDSSYTVEYVLAQEENTKKATFDYVVLAAPMHQAANILGRGNIKLPTATYCRVDHALICGTLKYSAFGILPGSVIGNKLPMILPSESAYEEKLCPFRSLFLLPTKVADGSANVYSSFIVPERSTDPIKSLTSFIDPVTPTNDIGSRGLKTEWFACPVYKPVEDPQEELGTFILAPNLYYANAIEAIASCMEIAAIGGRNVALLIAAQRRSSKQPT